GKFVAVLKDRPTAEIGKGLGRRALGQDDIVAEELDVEIFETIDRFELPDRHPVDEAAGWNKTAVEIERVLGREVEFACRHALAERSGGDTDRQYRRVAGDKPTVIGAPADPLDPLQLAGQRQDGVADRQVFDRPLAELGPDPSAAAEA